MKLNAASFHLQLLSTRFRITLKVLRCQAKEVKREDACTRRVSSLRKRFVCCVLTIGGLTCRVSLAKKAVDSKSKEDAQRISQAIQLANEYLVRSCASDGQFVYKLDEKSGSISHSYNIIRHEGAVYSLSEYYAVHHDSASLAAITRADGFLASKYMSAGIAPDVQVVWSKPDRSAADLGATGLGLVALASVERIRPGSVPIDQLRSLGRFGLFLERPDGSFIDKYRRTSGPVEDFESLYYPGEMALGFLSLYEIDRSKIWLDAAAKALVYLARRSANETTAPPDHWAMIATSKLFTICNREHIACPVSRLELIRYAEQVSESLLAEQQEDSGVSPLLVGSFGPSGRTAPTATRLEGLLAAMEFLPNGPLRRRIKPAVTLGVNFLLRAQVVTQPYIGGMPRSVLESEPGATEIRIDYVQHALCAWLRYQEMFGLHPKGSRK